MMRVSFEHTRIGHTYVGTGVIAGTSNNDNADWFILWVEDQYGARFIRMLVTACKLIREEGR